MKIKNSLLFMALFITLNSQAQNWLLGGNSGISSPTNFLGTTDNQQLVFKTNGLTRMTIGTNSGAVNTGAVTIGDLNPDVAPNYGGMLRIRSPFNTTALDLVRSTNSDPSGWDNQIRFYNTNGLRHLIADDFGSGKLIIQSTNNPTTGSVGIIEIKSKVQIGNVSTPSGYNLYVEQGILAERVKVAIKSTGDWADYVFEENYKLKPLTEVEKFIKKNKHLPNVPSANEMIKEGNDLAKTDALLLQKIEELTLYVIELKKENDLMKKEIQALQK